MSRRRAALLPAVLAFAGFLLVGPCALGRDTEEQLSQRIHTEQNPVKKAKEEVKLSSFKLARVQDAYSQGHFEDGVKALSVFMDTLQAARKTLHDSGRKAAKHSEGYRELEIALREDVRALKDLERVVDYFNRTPLEHAVKDMEQMQGELIHELFPGGPSRKDKESLPPDSPGVRNPPEAR